ncbi:hypothetical protein HDU93_004583 [Gonapodya sp. JEL0774]|nr:hypothetical protein HDU93_004583 [Gonapodya sp. JEL0774]
MADSAPDANTIGTARSSDISLVGQASGTDPNVVTQDASPEFSPTDKAITGPRTANAEATMLLIDAVEANDAEAVKKALQQGADPNARKLVTLKVNFEDGEMKTDTLPMESAMTLAIRNGASDDRAVEVVRALLEAGCDPNGSVEWKASNYFDVWTPQEWNGKYRWLTSYKYPSYLAFALTANKGRPFSEKGAHVVLDNPSNQDQRRDEFPLRPNIEIIRLLLQFGAKVAPSIVQLARKLPEHTILQLVEAPPKSESRKADVVAAVPEEVIAAVTKATGVDKLAAPPLPIAPANDEIRRGMEVDSSSSAVGTSEEPSVPIDNSDVPTMENPAVDHPSAVEQTLPTSMVVNDDGAARFRDLSDASEAPETTSVLSAFSGFPHFQMPSMPHVSMPHVSMPHVSMPHVSMPSVPHITLPSVADVTAPAMAAGSSAVSTITGLFRSGNRADEPHAAGGVLEDDVPAPVAAVLSSTEYEVPVQGVPESSAPNTDEISPSRLKEIPQSYEIRGLEEETNLAEHKTSSDSVPASAVPEDSKATVLLEARDRTPNERLIEAVEENDLEEVEKALADGADANARKSVTLMVNLSDGQKVEDTVAMESALCLAIRNGATERSAANIVRALLAAGADPNAVVEWKAANFFDKWTPKEWFGKFRWLTTYRFPSALEFALTTARAKPFSEKGGHVVLDNPADKDVRRDEFPLKPNMEIIIMLLRHGGKITTSALQAAKKSDDKAFVSFVEQEKKSQDMSTAPVKPSSHSTRTSKNGDQSGAMAESSRTLTEETFPATVVDPVSDVKTGADSTSFGDVPAQIQRDIFSSSEGLATSTVQESEDGPLGDSSLQSETVPEDASGFAVVEPRDSTANERLIEAAEENDLEGVRKALADGADPNARKSVTLKVNLSDGQKVEDTLAMESALCLAIRNGAADQRAVEVVETLLNAGANPNAVVEWKASNFFDKWTPKEWFGKFRWLTTYRFPSALEFALTTAHGKPFNEKGGHVVLDNPADKDVRRDEFPLKPNMDIILLLLRHGGKITNTALQAAKKHEDKSFVRFIEQQKALQMAPTVPAPGPGPGRTKPEIKNTPKRETVATNKSLDNKVILEPKTVPFVEENSNGTTETNARNRTKAVTGKILVDENSPMDSGLLPSFGVALTRDLGLENNIDTSPQEMNAVSDDGAVGDSAVEAEQPLEDPISAALILNSNILEVDHKLPSGIIPDAEEVPKDLATPPTVTAELKVESMAEGGSSEAQNDSDEGVRDLVGDPVEPDQLPEQIERGVPITDFSRDLQSVSAEEEELPTVVRDRSPVAAVPKIPDTPVQTAIEPAGPAVNTITTTTRTLTHRTVKTGESEVELIDDDQGGLLTTTKTRRTTRRIFRRGDNSEELFEDDDSDTAKDDVTPASAGVQANLESAAADPLNAIVSADPSGEPIAETSRDLPVDKIETKEKIITEPDAGSLPAAEEPNEEPLVEEVLSVPEAASDLGSDSSRAVVADYPRHPRDVEETIAEVPSVNEDIVGDAAVEPEPDADTLLARDVDSPPSTKTPNERLIEATEENDLEGVQNALADGADPNARKVVTLKVALSDDEKYEDTQYVESALCLAIRNGATDERPVEIVRALLERGADPNGQIDWKTANFYDKWTHNEWFGKFRWLATFKYPSALEFALTTSHGRPFNEKGGHVILDNPVSQDARRDEFPLLPNMQIVQLLLKYGGKITTAAVQAAKRGQDKKLVEFVAQEKKVQDALPPTPITEEKSADVESSGARMLPKELVSPTDEAEHPVELVAQPREIETEHKPEDGSRDIAGAPDLEYMAPEDGRAAEPMAIVSRDLPPVPAEDKSSTTPDAPVQIAIEPAAPEVNTVTTTTRTLTHRTVKTGESEVELIDDDQGGLLTTTKTRRTTRRIFRRGDNSEELFEDDDSDTAKDDVTPASAGVQANLESAAADPLNAIVSADPSGEPIAETSRDLPVDKIETKEKIITEPDVRDMQKGPEHQIGHERDVTTVPVEGVRQGTEVSVPEDVTPRDLPAVIMQSSQMRDLHSSPSADSNSVQIVTPAFPQDRGADTSDKSTAAILPRNMSPFPSTTEGPEGIAPKEFPVAVPSEDGEPTVSSPVPDVTSTSATTTTTRTMRHSPKAGNFEEQLVDDDDSATTTKTTTRRIVRHIVRSGAIGEEVVDLSEGHHAGSRNLASVPIPIEDRPQDTEMPLVFASRDEPVVPASIIEPQHIEEFPSKNFSELHTAAPPSPEESHVDMTDSTPGAETRRIPMVPRQRENLTFSPTMQVGSSASTSFTEDGVAKTTTTRKLTRRVAEGREFNGEEITGDDDFERTTTTTTTIIKRRVLQRPGTSEMMEVDDTVVKDIPNLSNPQPMSSPPPQISLNAPGKDFSRSIPPVPAKDIGVESPSLNSLKEAESPDSPGLPTPVVNPVIANIDAVNSIPPDGSAKTTVTRKLVRRKSGDVESPGEEIMDEDLPETTSSSTSRVVRRVVKSDTDPVDRGVKEDPTQENSVTTTTHRTIRRVVRPGEPDVEEVLEDEGRDEIETTTTRTIIRKVIRSGKTETVEIEEHGEPTRVGDKYSREISAPALALPSDVTKIAPTTTEPSPISDVDYRLFTAVEEGDLNLVKAHLKDGANADCRKVVSLEVTYYKRFVGRNLSDIGGSSTNETRNETILGESALAIAIRDKRHDVLRELLDSGADPSLPIEWKTPNYFDPWQQRDWEGPSRWLSTNRYPSALDFAVATSFAKPFNIKGAHVIYINPSKNDRLSEKYKLSPDLEIVRILLQHGSPVTDTSIAAARRLPNKQFFELLDGSSITPMVSRDVGAAPEAAASAEPAAVVSDLLEEPRSQEDDVRALLPQLQSQNSELQKNLDLLKKEFDHEVALIEKLEKDRALVAELLAANAELEKRTNDQARVIQDLVVQLEAEPAAPLHCVVVPFPPKLEDELVLRVGDAVSPRVEYSDGWAWGLNLATARFGFFPLVCFEDLPGNMPVEHAPTFPERSTSKDRPSTTAGWTIPTTYAFASLTTSDDASSRPAGGAA